MSQETSEPLTGKAGVEQFMGYERRNDSPISISKVASSRQSRRRKPFGTPRFYGTNFLSWSHPHSLLHACFQFHRVITNSFLKGIPSNEAGN